MTKTPIYYIFKIHFLFFFKFPDKISSEKRNIGFESRFEKAQAEEASYQDQKAIMLEEMKKRLKPELINRFDSIVIFHNLFRLDKYRSAGGRLVVYKTFNLTSVFAFYGNNVSVLSHGNDGILHNFSQAPVHIRSELIADSCVYIPYVFSD